MQQRKATRAAVMVASLALFAAIAAPASATDAEVVVSDFDFTPGVVAVSTGGGVNWAWDQTDFNHSVHQLKGLFDSGDPEKGSPEFRRIFSAGTFKYVCENHESMTGKVRSKLLLFDDDSMPLLQWATDGSSTPSQTGGKFDVQYKVESGEWKNWLKNTTEVQGTFGDGGSPIQLQLEKNYSFRARSQKGSDNTKVSGWSPVKKYFHNPT